MLKTTRTAATLLAALAATNALAQTTITNDVTVAPGGTLIVNDDTIYTGTVTIGAGAQVVIDTGFSVTFATGASLVVEGTEADPVMFFPINGTWEGLNFQAGASADIDYAAIMDFRVVGINSAGASVSLTGVELFDSLIAPAPFAATRYAIIASGSGTLTIDRSVIGPLTGRDGGDGGNGSTGNPGGTGSTGGAGRPVFGIDASDLDRLTLTSTRFVGLEGGAGGLGGRGGNGSTGTNGSNGGAGDNGGNGGQGRTGGRGGNGGAGGATTVAILSGINEITIAQNIVDRLSGGTPGNGGNGGTGGRGGSGGDGGDGGIFQDGGNGGNGGRGGTGGRGGDGGAAGPLQIFRIINPGTEPIIASNTLYQANAEEGGFRGDGGSGGSGGSRGDGGAGGFLASGGSNGSNGSTGSGGNNGINGANGLADSVITTGAAPSGFAARVHNNIFSYVGVGLKRPALSTDTGIIDITTNAFSGFDTLSTGPAIGGLSVVTGTPSFVDPSIGDFTPLAGTFLVDAGDNTLVPAVLTTDFLGNPRFADELSTPDTGSGGDFIVDYGAIEAVGDSVQPNDCLADTNGDGIVSPADFNAWILAFNSQADECDQNGDGLCTPADFNAWILNFNAGCD